MRKLTGLTDLLLCVGFSLGLYFLYNIIDNALDEERGYDGKKKFPSYLLKITYTLIYIKVVFRNAVETVFFKNFKFLFLFIINFFIFSDYFNMRYYKILKNKKYIILIYFSIKKNIKL